MSHLFFVMLVTYNTFADVLITSFPCNSSHSNTGWRFGGRYFQFSTTGTSSNCPNPYGPPCFAIAGDISTPGYAQNSFSTVGYSNISMTINVHNVLFEIGDEAVINFAGIEIQIANYRERVNGEIKIQKLPTSMDNNSKNEFSISLRGIAASGDVNDYFYFSNIRIYGIPINSLTSTTTTGFPTYRFSPPSFAMTRYPTSQPSPSPSPSPTPAPTPSPTPSPTTKPTSNPSLYPSIFPTEYPISAPSISPTEVPSMSPSMMPSLSPSMIPTLSPSMVPTRYPSLNPTLQPTVNPTHFPSVHPTKQPLTKNPTLKPTKRETKIELEVVSPLESTPQPTLSVERISNEIGTTKNENNEEVENTFYILIVALVVSITATLISVLIGLFYFCRMESRRNFKKEHHGMTVLKQVDSVSMSPKMSSQSVEIITIKATPSSLDPVPDDIDSPPIMNGDMFMSEGRIKKISDSELYDQVVEPDVQHGTNTTKGTNGFIQEDEDDDDDDDIDGVDEILLQRGHTTESNVLYADKNINGSENEYDEVYENPPALPSTTFAGNTDNK